MNQSNRIDADYPCKSIKAECSKLALIFEFTVHIYYLFIFYSTYQCTLARVYRN